MSHANLAVWQLTFVRGCRKCYFPAKFVVYPLIFDLQSGSINGKTTNLPESSISYVYGNG